MHSSSYVNLSIRFCFKFSGHHDIRIGDPDRAKLAANTTSSTRHGTKRQICISLRISYFLSCYGLPAIICYAYSAELHLLVLRAKENDDTCRTASPKTRI